ncbi:MAG: nitroreductase family protein [Desulfobacterales bacterium]|nr:MAG: nitroreductase family protein [Desulfobacterales bacterium]
MLIDLVRNNRSYRRFHQEVSIVIETLKELVELTRYCASAANLQPLKYVLSCEPQRNAAIFEHVSWAGYLKEWPGPSEGERPAAYIIVLGDTTVVKSFGCDHGIVGQTILLGAAEKGLGGCMIGSVRRKELREALTIPVHLDILLVIALGKPKERVVIETVEPDGDIKYWRDDQGVHHVPKRSLDEIIVG